MGKESNEMSSMYRWIVVAVGVVIAVLAFALESSAQSHEGLIYGKVYTDNTVYTGPLRWGNEEALWTDLFNASKTGDQFKNLVPEQKDENDSWFNIDWSFGSIWEDKIIAHQFTCQFGNLSQLTMINKNKVRVKFKNGKEVDVNGEGYNDVGAKIQIVDNELGVVSINWDRISKIEFMQTPPRLETIFGTPLFGTVESARREKFTGFIIWDNDERLSTDRLDGDSDDGDVSLKFSDIGSIEKEGRGSHITLKSGRDLYLSGSNDVNDENRGVLIVTPQLGVVKVSWTAFRKITFATPENSGPGYQQFTSPQFLQGTVSSLEGDDLTGRIIFDIDEMLDIEMLEGEENDIQYSIPFRNVKKITPKNYDFSSITLRHGADLLLGDGQDVSSKNGGVLVFVKGEKKPHYVSWRKINEITFN
jgi:hypothetical protein